MKKLLKLEDKIEELLDSLPEPFLRASSYLLLFGVGSILERLDGSVHIFVHVFIYIISAVVVILFTEGIKTFTGGTNWLKKGKWRFILSVLGVFVFLECELLGGTRNWW